MTHGAAAIGDGRHVVADPQARAIGQHVSRLDGESLAAADCLPHEIADVGPVVGLDQVLDAHLQQFRRRTPDEAAISVVHQGKAPRHVDLGDAHDGLVEHGAENVLLLAQLGFDAFPHRDMRAQGEAHNRNAEHERDQGQERVGRGRARERPAARQRAPGSKARENEHGGRRVPPSAPQRGPQQRHRCQEPQRASVHALLDERTEGDKAYGSRRDNGGAAGQGLVQIEASEIFDRPQHDDRRDHQRARRVAKPPCGADGDEVPPVEVTGEVEAADADDRADHRAGSEADHGEFRDSGRRIEGFAALGPGVDQAAADDRCKRVARGNAQGQQDRVGNARIGNIGRHANGKCRGKNRRPNAQPAQEDGGQGNARGRPDGDGARVDRGERQADFRQNKIAGADDRQLEGVFRHAAGLQRCGKF